MRASKIQPEARLPVVDQKGCFGRQCWNTPYASNTAFRTFALLIMSPEPFSAMLNREADQPTQAQPHQRLLCVGVRACQCVSAQCVC